MAIHNLYLTYKRDTQYLVYWLIRTSNRIIKSLPTTDPDASRALKTSSQATVAELLSLSQLIAKHISPVPTAIFRLFQAVIRARTLTHEAFQRIITNKPDPSMQRSNETHKFFIDALTEVFHSLGGASWRPDAKSEDDDEKIDQVLFSNKFASLGLGSAEPGALQDDEGGAHDDASDEDVGPVATPQRRQQKKSKGKGNKNKRNKKPKKKPSGAAKDSSLDDVPIESYRIIEDGDGLVTDYLLAVYSLTREWSELRGYVQDLWYDVAYRGLNSAVAGTVSNMAIALMKQSESAIFVDFPGHDSYDVVMNTITRGNPDGAQGQFKIGLHVFKPGASEMEKVQETEIDVKEQFMVYTYRDLLDFILDFQSTRSGKPTKATTAQIRDWDPYFDLKRATKDQRIKWRRSYTIKWLYDLVNVFSSIVVQRNKLKGERHAYERVDWSTKGPWNQHRRLFGLNEFAGVITSLAMQKPGTDIRKMILPSHVLQLQCIVDSFAVSRGWSNSALQGHILTLPSRNFKSRRDVDLFLDREQKRLGHGFLSAVNILKQLFDKESEDSHNPSAHQAERALLDGILWEFVNWLGESKYMSGLNGIPPSQFSNTNSNGLWEYSPFLCGVGLMEGLELAYATGMFVWERIPEPMLVIHLHNMLVQKGFIEKPVGLYATLEEIYRFDFFAGGKIPTSNFNSALLDVIGQTSSHFASIQRRQAARTASRTTTDTHGLLDTKINRFYKTKTMLITYRQGEWNYERIPEEYIPESSILARIRIAQTTPTVNTASGDPRFEGHLADRMRAAGIDLNKVKTELLTTLDFGKPEVPQTVLNSLLPEGYSWGPSSNHIGNTPKSDSQKLPDGDPNTSMRTMLSFLKFDILVDVCGELRPLSSLNYVFVTTMLLFFFDTLEKELGQLRNSSYVSIYDGPGRHKPKFERRILLVTLALSGEDEELLRVMAKRFNETRSGFMTHMYWEDLADMEELFEMMESGGHGNVPAAGSNCVMM